MSITSSQKASLLVGILVIIGCGAFVYFDPLDLDLMGLKQKSVDAKSAVTPRAAAPKTAVPAIQAKTPVAVPPPTPSHAATSPVAAPKIAVAPPQAKAPAATAPSATAVPVTAIAAPPVAAAVQAAQPPMKLSKATSTASRPAMDKPVRPKNLDLRHCLDLETDVAIAKCAGE